MESMSVSARAMDMCVLRLFRSDATFSPIRFTGVRRVGLLFLMSRVTTRNTARLGWADPSLLTTPASARRTVWPAETGSLQSASSSLGLFTPVLKADFLLFPRIVHLTNAERSRSLSLALPLSPMSASMPVFVPPSARYVPPLYLLNCTWLIATSQLNIRFLNIRLPTLFPFPL